MPSRGILGKRGAPWVVTLDGPWLSMLFFAVDKALAHGSGGGAMNLLSELSSRLEMCGPRVAEERLQPMRTACRGVDSREDLHGGACDLSRDE